MIDTSSTDSFIDLFEESRTFSSLDSFNKPIKLPLRYLKQTTDSKCSSLKYFPIVESYSDIAGNAAGTLTETPSKLGTDETHGDDFIFYQLGEHSRQESPSISALSSSSSSSPTGDSFVSPSDLVTTCSSFSAPASTVTDSLPLFANDNENVNVQSKSEVISCKSDPHSDPAQWSPLFSPPLDTTCATTMPSMISVPVEDYVPPIEHRFVREKRSAIVMEGECPSHKDDSRKKLKNSCSPDMDSVDLPPIIVKNPGDPVAVRRARNTEAARRSRARKNERITELEQLVSELQAKNFELKTENSLLKKLNQLH